MQAGDCGGLLRRRERDARRQLRLDGPEQVVADPLRDFAVRLVLATHPASEFATETVKRYVRWGASPRAAQARGHLGVVRREAGAGIDHQQGKVTIPHRALGLRAHAAGQAVRPERDRQRTCGEARGSGGGVAPAVAEPIVERDAHARPPIGQVRVVDKQVDHVATT